MLMALAAVVASIILEHGNPNQLVQWPPLVLVFGGSLAAMLAGAVRRDVRALPAALVIAFRPRQRYDAVRFTQHLIQAAHAARSNGISELERGLPEAKRDPFVRTGVELVLTTSDPERVRLVLDAEMEGVRRRHAVAYGAVRDLAGYAPTLGILGTVIGLVRVLGGISDPTLLGPAIASAFTATLWGVFSANLIWLPIANKLRRMSQSELAYKELVTEGLLAVQEGMSGLRLKDRLDPFLAPSERPDPLLAGRRRAA